MFLFFPRNGERLRLKGLKLLSQTLSTDFKSSVPERYNCAIILSLKVRNLPPAMENLFKPEGIGSWLRCVVVLLVLNLGITGSYAQTSDALLNLFIQKGFVTKQEAEMVKAEAEAMQTTNLAKLPAPVPASVPESVWKVNKAIKSVELFGDIRLRYEGRQAEDPEGGEIGLQRFRYSVRLGLRGEVFDDFYYGVRVDTSLNARSSWNTFGSSANAPFGKTANGIGIGQVYLGWHPTDWADLTVGKMANPFFTTSMVWDGDINPEGAAERFKFTVGQADFFGTFGQFLYQDTNPNKATQGYFNLDYNSANLPFLLGWQLGVNYHLTKTLDLKVAPVLYNYTSHGANNLNLTSPGFPTRIHVPTKSLAMDDLPPVCASVNVTRSRPCTLLRSSGRA